MKPMLYTLSACIGLLAGLGHLQSAYGMILTEPVRMEVEVLPQPDPTPTKAPTPTPTPEPEYNDESIPDDVEEAAVHYGEKYNICQEFLQALAYYESRYQTDAVNGNCIGLMQINIDAQYRRMEELGITEEELYKADANMYVAADYLAELFSEHEDVGMVLMKYNGDSRANDYFETGILSGYAERILEMSEELERKHERREQ